MDITSQITVSMKPERSKSLGHLNAIVPGSTLKLKILELRGDRALIDFGNFRATADVKIPVTLGEELRVKVLTSGEQLKMAVIRPEQENPLATERLPGRLEAPAADSLEKVQAEVKRILNQALEAQVGKSIPKSIVNILNGLNTYYEPIELKEAIAKLMPRLKSYLENSGVFFEKNLENSILKDLVSSEYTPQKPDADRPDGKHILSRDLKANLMALKFLMEEGQSLQKFFNARSLATLNKGIDSLLHRIIQQQGRAVSQLEAAEPFQVFTYLLPLSEEEQSARLKVYYKKKQPSGSEKGFRISLLLTLDRLGDLRTDFFLLDEELSISFFVKDDSTRVNLQNNLPELHELLHGFFDQIRLNVIVSEKKVMDFDREDLQIAGQRRVDLKSEKARRTSVGREITEKMGIWMLDTGCSMLDVDR